MRFEFPEKVKLSTVVFVVTQCAFVDGYDLYRGTYRLCLRGSFISGTVIETRSSGRRFM